MLRDVEVDDSPSIMGENHKDEQHSAGNSWDNKEVDRNQISEVLVKKRPPGGRPRPVSTRSVFFHGRFGDLDSKLRELGNDSR
jgi:hypothetical protein